MRGEAGDRLRGPVEGVEVELAVAVGAEVEPVRDPHRVGVVRATRGLRHRLDRVRRGVEQQDARGGAAPVVLPLGELLRERHVGDRLPVGRHVRLARVRDLELRGKAATDRHREQLRVARGVDLARGREEHRLSVRREAQRDVAARVVGEPPGHPALRVDHVDVGIALVTAGEGNEPAVGREARTGLDAGVRRQAADARPVARGHPEVVGVGEGHERAARGRLSDEAGVGEVDRASPRGGDERESCEGDERAGHPLPPW